MRRSLSLQFTNLPIDRLRLKARRRGTALPEPLALYAGGAKGEVLRAADAAAMAKGVTPGLRLADARAMLPELVLAPATPEADQRFLEGLALACQRYTPKVALDGHGADALLLDITGSAHLFGGEAGLLRDLGQRLDRRGLGHRLAIADTQAAAWAWARHGKGGILAAGAGPEALQALSVRGLRLDAETTAALERLGLHCVGQLQAIPGRPLVRRFGVAPVLALGRLFGGEPETFKSLHEPPRFSARIGWAEPIGRTEDIAAAIGDLAARLAGELERAVAGARACELLLFRVDGEVARLAMSTGRPSRDAAHLRKLFELQLDGLDIGFGIDAMRLDVTDMAPLPPEQAGLGQDQDAAALALLVDQLQQRLGRDAVQRLVPVQSHWPEQAQAGADPASPPEKPGAWLAGQPRPLRLLDRPARIEAMAPIPDGPPILLRRSGQSGKVKAATGPERIEPEWWHAGQPQARPRDYYRVTDSEGRLLWLYREGRFGDHEPPAWHVHGVFE